ncbi:hypothetical protein PIB30_075404 [Stylosanthes scabra]|uniref:Uncharacterized protein n=1 Tax=Stylosanthes scabra TaxID=79078 RepID=A0ABU6ZNK0_9FABA|nr:hypothetical protein [Stylosanthes scabra]
MAYRVPHAVHARKWQLVDVDDDIRCLFDMHPASGGFRTMYLYVESEMGENEVETPVVGRTANTQSSQASAQRNSDNSTPDSLRNPPDSQNPLMKDILSDISDLKDDFLHAEEDDADIDLGQPSQTMPTIGEPSGKAQILAIGPPSYFVPPSSQFSDINWEALDGSNEFPEVRSEEE